MPKAATFRAAPMLAGATLAGLAMTAGQFAGAGPRA